MEQNIKDACTELIQITARMKADEQRARQLKNQIIGYHQQRNLDVIEEDGVKMLLSHCTRKTPMLESIKTLLGRDIPVECFKITPYDSVHVELIEG